jgi:hypothetical protein
MCSYPDATSLVGLPSRSQPGQLAGKYHPGPGVSDGEGQAAFVDDLEVRHLDGGDEAKGHVGAGDAATAGNFAGQHLARRHGEDAVDLVGGWG